MMMEEMSEELSSALTFVLYGVSSFCIFTAYSTVFRHHSPLCIHHHHKCLDDTTHVPLLSKPSQDPYDLVLKPEAQPQDDNDDDNDNDSTTASEDDVVAANTIDHEAAARSTETLTTNDDTSSYWHPWMPKFSTLQEHHGYYPLYTCVCQLPVATPVPDLSADAADTYPEAICISCDDDIFPTSKQAMKTKPALPAKVGTAESKQQPMPAPAPGHHAQATNYVVVVPTAHASTRARRDMSLYRAKITVGLAVATVALKEVYSVRLELNCPDNATSHLVSTILWSFTTTVAEVTKLRAEMEAEVDDSDALLALAMDSRDDVQAFFDAVTEFPLWADAPSLRKFCQMW
ncbi:Aste57867_691 [Aphanomyces stellatus]|uniref:Aste57867_691 protein n=1 Tax=Aphanomyces stellatus TaxID=120398 RepID=A0A485K7D5_9STRA|nr:hypothetical protein As57867_000690 [Aphanomyces stellatus]VFT77916.1 Aste57867_691 [Aphanomyces stellatus]